ncbi:hypothetical protein NDU88_003519 [Pleurodeles waltl]|uniref:Uncharacterized protein n=1 Tax=Pleurodeles waltl TaxID=8319 RepID=A0AAV7L674_PLEWA|nr:hypothetical protein NDU88_003519 [Pleurodeles waltl]
MNAARGPLDYFATRLFQHFAPALKDQEIILDRTHRVGQPSQAPVVGVWEALKAVVRGHFIALAAHANTLRKEKRHQLEAQIKELEERHTGVGAGETQRQLGVARKELRALDIDAAEHAMLCTKQMYYVGENKVGRLLAHRLRAQAVQCRVTEI